VWAERRVVNVKLVVPIVTTGLRSFESIKIKPIFVFTNNCLLFQYQRDVFLEEHSVGYVLFCLRADIAATQKATACTAVPEHPFSKVSMNFFKLLLDIFSFPLPLFTFNALSLSLSLSLTVQLFVPPHTTNPKAIYVTPAFNIYI
jgi:hypothetical protein